MSYRFLSQIYDACKNDFWIKNSHFFSFYQSNQDKSILDLGCGTGLSIQHLKINPCDYIGVDCSLEMLSHAKNKFPEHSFYNQSILDFHHPKRFQLVICSFDTINHFLRSSEWSKIFDISFSHLKPGGTFVFDVFTEYDLKFNWPNQMNLVDSKNWVYIQRSSYDTDKEMGIIDNTIFLRSKNGWDRYDEQIRNISLNSIVVENLLRDSGFQQIQKIDFNTGKSTTKETERILFYCIKG